MKESDFKESKYGRLVWESNGYYYHFEPNKLPLPFDPNTNLSKQLEKTAIVLGRLDGISRRLKPEEVNLVQRPFIIKEAKFSSEIEGTRSTITEVYKSEKQKETNIEKKLDTEEIQNYGKALQHGLNHQGDITEKLIKEIHFILLNGARGSDKSPGEYKTNQNAIGERQDTLETAKFIPASSETTPDLMKNFEEYINGQNETNLLYRVGIAHYQFESIHPFRDGNGRIGRLLIMLHLCKSGIISKPLLYISEYFNRNRSTYTELLYGVSSSNNMNEWVEFFLKGLEIQSINSMQLIDRLENYKNDLDNIVSEVSNTHNIHLIVNELFKNPFVTITEISKLTGLTIAGASHLVHKLEAMGILQEITNKGSSKLFMCKGIIDILESSQK